MTRKPGPIAYSEVIDELRRASVPIRELGSPGRVAITLAAGRVIAMAFSPDAPNLLWSNPDIHNTELIKHHPEKLVGGLGGDRLWFAPETAFHWDGKPDWQTFANYKVPKTADPGEYRFLEKDADGITLCAQIRLPLHGSDRSVGFEVTRSFRMTEPPLPRSDPLMRGIDYVGIETAHRLRIADETRTGLIDLWHLLQIPAGSVLIVPIRKDVAARPLSYGLPGHWEEKSDHIVWRYGGEAKAKFGLSAAALTGRSAVLRQWAPDRWGLIVRQFPVDPQARYGDHPHGVPRHDQAFQAWDGYEFGEMEFHSPVLDAEIGPRELAESDQLWAFGGDARPIASLAEPLLGIDVRYVLGI